MRNRFEDMPVEGDYPEWPNDEEDEKAAKRVKPLTLEDDRDCD